MLVLNRQLFVWNFPCFFLWGNRRVSNIRIALWNCQYLIRGELDIYSRVKRLRHKALEDYNILILPLNKHLKAAIPAPVPTNPPQSPAAVAGKIKSGRAKVAAIAAAVDGPPTQALLLCNKERSIWGNRYHIYDQISNHITCAIKRLWISCKYWFLLPSEKDCV